MIKGALVGDKAARERFNRAPANYRTRIYAAVAKLAIKLQRKVMFEKLSGQVLKTRTGNLRRSITQKVVETAKGAVGIVGTNVPYAGAHEFGATIRAHDVFPKSGGVLRFDWRGKTVFARSVHIPTYKIPQRSFLRTSLREMIPEIKADLRQAGADAWSDSK